MKIWLIACTVFCVLVFFFGLFISIYALFNSDYYLLISGIGCAVSGFFSSWTNYECLKMHNYSKKF